MRVHLSVDVRTARGRTFARKLSAYRELMDHHSADDELDVVVEEGRGRWYDVIVTRPRYAPPPDDSWFVIRRDGNCRYVRSFENPSPAELASAILLLMSTR